MEEFSILVDFKPCGSLTKDIYVISIEIFSSAIHCIPARSSIVNWNRIGQSEIFSSVFNARPLWSDIIVNHHHHYHHHYHHNPPTYHSFHIINIERFLSGTQSWKSSALGWVIIIIIIIYRHNHHHHHQSLRKVETVQSCNGSKKAEGQLHTIHMSKTIRKPSLIAM